MEKITKAEFKIRRDETALDFYKCGLEHAGMSSKEIETIKTEAKYEIKRSII